MTEELIQQEQPVEETQVEQAAPAQPTQTDEERIRLQKEEEQIRNFRAVREAADRHARERDEAMQRLAEYERKYGAQQQRTPEPEPDIDIDSLLNIKDDELVEGKHVQQLKKTIKTIAAKQKALEQQSYTTSAEARLRSQYSDFDKVMTLDNIKSLSNAFPEFARTINASTDLYDKAASAYTLIKRFGIYEEKPYEAEKNRALENIAKPKPLSSISPQQGDSPLSRANVFANGLTEDLKKQLREEMAAASKRY